MLQPLPPLKFWESPAQEIEDYINKQVFKKRMQKAIEINKMNCISNKDHCPHDSSVMALDEQELLSELRKFPEAHSEMDLFCRGISSNLISAEIIGNTKFLYFSNVCKKSNYLHHSLDQIVASTNLYFLISHNSC